jgi:hypothetical protein
VPIVWLIREGRHPSAAAAAWLCCLTPVLNRFTPLSWPNLIPLAAMICVWALQMEVRVPRFRELSSASQAAA